MKELTYIDLFAGCGGLSLGLHNSGWKGLFAIEKSPHAFATLKYNLIAKKNHFSWPDWLSQKNHDINELIENYSHKLTELRGKVTMIAGGPPCQGFSIAGQRNENDSRNNLIKSYVKFVSLVKPEIVFFENVKGFTMAFKNNQSKGCKYSQIVSESLKKEGYTVHGKLINFGDYGVPQKRTRFILVGVRNDLSTAKFENVKSFFDILEQNRFSFLEEKKLSVHTTVKEALSDLLSNNIFVETPDRKNFKSTSYKRKSSPYQTYVRSEVNNKTPDSHSFANHSSQVVNRLNYIIKISNRCKNLDDSVKNELGIKKQVLVPLQANEQAPTITSHPDDMVHYCEPRILTVREYARLQSFPDSYEFKGKYTTGGKLRKVEVPRYTQIGNAIPPLFAELAGLTIKEMFAHG